jgi:anti-sigma28 factor (negative regulator of flagellin synthesis)
MRIEDTKRISYDTVKPGKRDDGTSVQATSQSSTGEPDVSRAERIEKLKNMFSEGRPIDVNKLADKLVQSGIFFNDKA